MRDLLTLHLLRLAAWLTTDGRIRTEIRIAIREAERSRALTALAREDGKHLYDEEDWG